MSLLPDDPFKRLANVRKDFDRMFSAFPFDMNFLDSMLGNAGIMKIDVYETATEVVATCDIPGLEKKDDIQITVAHNLLTISGFMNKATEVNNEHMFRQERYTGSFHRAISLPSPVAQTGVKAIYRNGVLEVRMPKTTQIIDQAIDIQFE